jgi:phosphatidylserine/phosphatidylglycerophosphate/cardiolipin synthase-like enzyme
LSEAATLDLERLLSSIERGRVALPLTIAQLDASGLGVLTPHIESLLSLDRGACCAVLRAVLAERGGRGASPLELVWTGPDVDGGQARYTAVIVRELFERARKHVIIGGYSFDHGEALFAPLYKVMVEHGVKVDVFVDIGQMDTSLRRWARAERRDMRERLKLLRAARDQSNAEYANAVVAWFLDAQWPFGDPKPAVHFDARTAHARARVSLHAKCLIVDHRWALITSANFTERGHSRNIEAGVVINDAAFATKLATQWMGLRSH